MPNSPNRVSPYIIRPDQSDTPPPIPLVPHGLPMDYFSFAIIVHKNVTLAYVLPYFANLFHNFALGPSMMGSGGGVTQSVCLSNWIITQLKLIN